MTTTTTTTRTRTRSAERKQFLTDVLITAVEHCGYGFFTSKEWEPDADEPYAVIQWHDGEEWLEQRIDLDTISKGLGVIRRAVMRETERDGEVLHNSKTGERMYLHPEQRKNIMLADRTNYDEGDLDVVDALAVLECALFGRVEYA
ncbi:hypothetical protein [Micromonospora sp. GCM10011541]|uniref:hypothetical protein n=1 Tax=Micromonospora sp. GCM10011541 TaxID=3317336 RepID=UPI00360FFB43